LTLDAEWEPVGKALRFANDRRALMPAAGASEQLWDEIIVGLEATGHYWLALYSVLRS
jgi:transposase